MTDQSVKLSAYLDGELDVSEAMAVEAHLASSPEAQAELDALVCADAFAQEQFEAQLDETVPLALAKLIKTTPLTAKPVRSGRIWNAMAASLVVFCLGGAGGYLLNENLTPQVEVAGGGWLADVADYHEIYASQSRHLVEVGAQEADHIETWLGRTVGADFSIPDLSEFGLTFEGGRLLVAGGKPVAQLMYTQADGTVIALCLQNGTTEAGEPTSFQEQTINDFDFVSWNADGVDYVVIGPNGQPDLNMIATTAALRI